MNKYDIAAYIWPSYHPDPRAKIFWPAGVGEWETVMKNQPKYEGHLQPRYPLWGYVNEADPYVMQMQIEAASDHGVNVFIFDWYWYDGMPFLEGCLNNGYLKAKNNDKVKFYLMWANHDVNMTWDIRNSDSLIKKENNSKNGSIIWTGRVKRTEFEKICEKYIKEYFSHPSYYKIDNKPVFMIYDVNNFIRGLGGIDEAVSALDWFRGKVVEAGHSGLELQATLRRDNNRSLSGIDGDNIGTQKDVIGRLRFDSLSHYQFCHIVNVDRDYNEVVKDVIKEWHNIDKNYPAVYYPHISVGWDSSPRYKQYVGSVIKNNTPENFENALIEARNFIDAHPDRKPLITINSWNEWTETSYLQPCTMYGYGYLEAIKKVFK